MGEKRCWKTSAAGLIEPLPLTMMRKLFSISPFLSRKRRNLAGPGPRLMAAESTVRAPAITASAVARNSSKCFWSRMLPNDDTARFAVPIFPSAVIAMFTKTNGSLEP